MIEIVLASLVGLILGIWILWRRRALKYDPPLPPGNCGLPFIGETLHLLYTFKTNTPAEFFKAREHKYGSRTFKTHLFGCPTIAVAPPDGVKLLFQNHYKLVQGTWPSAMKTLIGEKSLFFMQGDKAKSFRHILMAFLGPEAIQRYVGRASRMIENHLESDWKGRSQVKVYDSVKEALFMVVFDLFLSIRDKEELEQLLSPFLVLLQGVLELPVDIPGTKFHKAKNARKTICTMLDKYIRQRRKDLEVGNATENQDLLSVLLTTRGEDGEYMSDEEIKQNILMLVLAGHDTSTSSLIVTIKCIAEHPWCYDELRKEHLGIAATKEPGEPLNFHDLRQMKYTWKVIQEAMRFIPATTGILREALVDFEMDGFTIPKGWQLVMSMYRSHRKEEFFPEPNKFDPERFNGAGPVPYTYTPFGGGARICPGYELAKMQDCVFLYHLVTKFKWSLVDPDEAVQMAPMAFPAKGLPIKLVSNPILQ